MSDASRFETRPEYTALAESLRVLLERDFDLGRPGRPGRPGRVVVGVAGESGSGKSVTAASLARALTAAGVPAGVLHQDDYFVRPPRSNHEHRLRDLGAVGPHEVHLAHLAEHVRAFREGHDGVDGPLVDYPGNRFVTQRHDFAGLAALVVEGTYVLTLPDLDVRVFLEATHEDTRARRLARARDVDDPIIDVILEIEHARIAPQAAAADVLIDRDFTVRRRRDAG